MVLLHAAAVKAATHQMGATIWPLSVADPMLLVANLA